MIIFGAASQAGGSIGRLIAALVIGAVLIACGGLVLRRQTKSIFARSTSLGESKGLALGPALIVGGAIFVILAVRDLLAR